VYTKSRNSFHTALDGVQSRITDTVVLTSIQRITTNTRCLTLQSKDTHSPIDTPSSFHLPPIAYYCSANSPSPILAAPNYDVSPTHVARRTIASTSQDLTIVHLIFLTAWEQC
jgi:hypothetical protein